MSWSDQSLSGCLTCFTTILNKTVHDCASSCANQSFACVGVFIGMHLNAFSFSFHCVCLCEIKMTELGCVFDRKQRGVEKLS